MPLCRVGVSRNFSDRIESYGYFVIDSPHSTQADVLASLTVEDKRKIANRLGMARYPSESPAHTEFQLSMFGEDPGRLPQNPTFTSEAGLKIWTFPISD
jgi:hypothetical protein